MPFDIRSTFLPYCIKQQEDGRYAVLNRAYKPVGFWTRSHIAYEAYPTLVKINGLTPAQAVKISCTGKADTKSIYLYNDGCVPTQSNDNMTQYLERLAVFARLEIDGEPPA